MKFIPQKLAGVFLIEPEAFQDDRGRFHRSFCINEFAPQEMDTVIKQCNISENKYAFTLRGFHYQKAPHAEAKTFHCFRGAIYNTVVDLRPESPTFKEWVSFEIDAENRKSIHVPKGCANAFMTLKDDTAVHYYISEFYTPGSEAGIRYDDPQFKFEWPRKPIVISEKDKFIPDFVFK